MKDNLDDFFFDKDTVAQPSVARLIDANNYHPPERMRHRWLFDEQIAHNKRATVLLIFGFILLICAVIWAAGYLLWSPDYAYFMAIGAAIVTFFSSFYSYYHSADIVLNMSNARPINREEYPHLINTLEGLCLASGVETVPAAYIIDDSAPNAFATGRDEKHAAIVVTTGLLNKLDRYQLEGVLAHELSHVANRDILLMTLASVMVGTVVLLSDWLFRTMIYGGGRRNRRSGGGGNIIFLLLALLMLILAPIIAQFMRLAVSRQREYLADANAVKLTRYPGGLAGALEVISQDYEPLEAANKATAHLYISNPLHEYKGWLNSLFSTHPPIEERISRLRQM